MECFRNEIDILLDRNAVKVEIEDYIKNRTSDKWIDKKCLFIHSTYGTGKTSFVTQTIKSNDYNLLYYNSLDINSNSLIDIKRAATGSNIISSLTKKQLVLVIDDIYFKTNEYKNITNLLYKLCCKVKIPKTVTKKITKNTKNKKDFTDTVIRIPIICIGNFNEKKNRDMEKICHILHLQAPSDTEIRKIMNLIMPNIYDVEYWVNVIQGNLKVMTTIYELYKDGVLFDNAFNHSFTSINTYPENIKTNVHTLITEPLPFSNHSHFINDGDKSLIGLLFHENVIDYISDDNTYLSILDNFCFADFIDRICFKKQIWQLNELSFYIKTFKNNQIIMENEVNIGNQQVIDNGKELRFTKILTKYSTEYNNRIFFLNIMNELNADKKDILSWLYKHNKIHTNTDTLLEKYPLSKLELNRLIKFINISIPDSTETIEETNNDVVDLYE
jgi:hypothetical protein